MAHEDEAAAAIVLAHVVAERVAHVAVGDIARIHAGLGLSAELELSVERGDHAADRAEADRLQVQDREFGAVVAVEGRIRLGAVVDRRVDVEAVDRRVLGLDPGLETRFARGRDQRRVEVLLAGAVVQARAAEPLVGVGVDRARVAATAADGIDGLAVGTGEAAEGRDEGEGKPESVGCIHAFGLTTGPAGWQGGNRHARAGRPGFARRAPRASVTSRVRVPRAPWRPFGR